MATVHPSRLGLVPGARPISREEQLRRELLARRGLTHGSTTGGPSRDIPASPLAPPPVLDEGGPSRTSSLRAWPEDVSIPPRQPSPDASPAAPPPWSRHRSRSPPRASRANGDPPVLPPFPPTFHAAPRPQSGRDSIVPRREALPPVEREEAHPLRIDSTYATRDNHPNPYRHPPRHFSGPVNFEQRRLERASNPLSIWPPSPEHPYRDSEYVFHLTCTHR